MIRGARHDTRLVQDGDVVATVSAAESRVPLVRAARLYEAALLRWDGVGDEPEESIEAEAGAILEQEAAIDVRVTRELLEGLVEALERSDG